MGQKRVQLTVRLPERLHEDLGKLTERLGKALERRVSRNDALVEALRCGVDSLMERSATKNRRRELRQEDQRVTRAFTREQKALEELERARADAKRLRGGLERAEEQREHLLRTIDFIKGYTPVLMLVDPAGRAFVRRVPVGALRADAAGQLICVQEEGTCQVVTDARWANAYVRVG